METEKLVFIEVWFRRRGRTPPLFVESLGSLPARVGPAVGPLAPTPCARPAIVPPMPDWPVARPRHHPASKPALQSASPITPPADPIRSLPPKPLHSHNRLDTLSRRRTILP